MPVKHLCVPQRRSVTIGWRRMMNCSAAKLEVLVHLFLQR